MPVRFQIKQGMLQVAQSFDFPAVYLDHWAIRRFSSDINLKTRFILALKACGGTLVFSHTNLAEIGGPDDPRHVKEIAVFLEDVLPNIYFAMFDIEKSIQQESRSQNLNERLPAVPDIELLLEVARLRIDDFQLFSIQSLIENIAANRDKLNLAWLESNQELADHINNVRLNPQTIKQAKDFKSHSSLIPTKAIMQEMLRPIFLDKTLNINRNDAGDIHHAISSITYCDYALLDGKWEAIYGRMLRRFDKLGISLHVAKVFSERRQGLELFLKELESRVVT